MRQIILFIGVIVLLASCSKTVDEAANYDSQPAKFFIKNPPKTFSAADFPPDPGNSISSLYNKELPGYMGSQWVYLKYISKRVSKSEAFALLRAEGYEPAGPGYLVGLAKEHIDDLSEDMLIACINTGSMTFTPWRSTVPEPLDWMVIENIYHPEPDYDLYGTSITTLRDTYYICFKK